MMARMRHTLHLCFKPHYWVAYIASLVGAVGIAIAAHDWRPETTAAYFTGYFELFGSIAVAIGLAHVFTVDQDEGAKEVLLTYPASQRRLGLERLIAGFMLSAGPLLLIAGALHIYARHALGPDSAQVIRLDAILLDSAVSWLYLAGIALLVSTLANNGLAGLFASGLYWVTDLLSHGKFTSVFFLFARTFPSATLSADVNRMMLAMAGVLTCTMAIFLFGRQPARW